MAPMQPKVPTTPWGYQRMLRAALANLDGVDHLGGSRRWWLLGTRAPGICVFFDDDDSIHVEVCAVSRRGAEPCALGESIQEIVVQTVTACAASAPAAVDVVIVPGI